MSDSKKPGRDVPRATDARSSMEGAQNGRDPRPAGHAAGTGAPSHPGHRGSAGTHKPLQIKIGGSAAPHRYSATGGQRPARPHASAADAIEQASGVRPQMIRAPYGAFTATEWARSADLISCNVLWNIDTLDWKLPGASSITNNVLTNAYNGAIALMHDGGGNRSQDVEALPAIIDGLRADGYELVTVSELMELDGRFPEDVVNGTVEMPEDAVLPAL